VILPGCEFWGWDTLPEQGPTCTLNVQAKQLHCATRGVWRRLISGNQINPGLTTNFTRTSNSYYYLFILHTSLIDYGRSNSYLELWKLLSLAHLSLVPRGLSESLRLGSSICRVGEGEQAMIWVEDRNNFAAIHAYFSLQGILVLQGNFR
jgi:hypothetical protein